MLTEVLSLWSLPFITSNRFIATVGTVTYLISNSELQDGSYTYN